jgi:hypothetical protein
MTATNRTQRHSKPYRLITTDDQTRTLRDGQVSYHTNLLDASNAFVKSAAPYKTIVFDDGCTARELTDTEQAILERVCELLGYELADAE